jgi:hypothetical protein
VAQFKRTDHHGVGGGEHDIRRLLDLNVGR